MANQADEMTKFKNTIVAMDEMSQEGFEQISSVAGLIIQSIGAGSTNNSDILNALQLIKYKANDMMNCINCEAEEVGCNYKEAEHG